MSDKIYAVPAEWAARAWIDEQSTRPCTSARSRTRTASGARWASGSTGSSPTPRSRTPPSLRATSRSSGTRTARSTSAANCVDRHLKTRGDQVAIIWEGDDPTQRREDHLPPAARARLASSPTCSKANGVKKGDRVTIYLPMIPEAAYAMLACARIGAVHSVVFGGFSPESLANRIEDADSKLHHHRPTRACAAAGRSRSRRTPTRR